MSSGAAELAAIPISDSSKPFAGGVEHLFAELDLLRSRLHREVLRLRAAGLFTEDQFRGLYVSDLEVDAVLLQSYASRQTPVRPATVHPSLRGIDAQIQLQREVILHRARLSAQAGIPLPLLRLANLYRLSEFEVSILILAAAVELDLHFETLFRYAQNDVNKRRPTVNLALRLLCSTQEECWQQRSVLQSESPLLREILLTAGEDAGDREFSFLERPLKTEARVIDFLLGQGQCDSRLSPFTSLSRNKRPLSQLRLPQALLEDVHGAVISSAPDKCLFLFHGPAGSGKSSLAGALCAEAGRPLLIADLRAALLSSVPLPTVLALLHREAILQGADLFLRTADAFLGDDTNAQQHRAAFQRALRVSGEYRVFVSTESPNDLHWTAAPPRPLSFAFPVPSFNDRVALWRQAIAELPGAVAPSVDASALANKFVLTGGEILRSCQDARQIASVKSPGVPITMEDFEAGARAQSHHGLRRLAQKVTPASDWSALVLPPHSLRQLRDVAASEKYRHLVYSKWGFDKRLSMGKGLNALFCGASGTGKTMAAGILARELALDLYKIDLSMVVSKYIGETEKQLNVIFREARSSNTILFFDEADALFGKRSEVKDAHDRYANIEVAYLLQKMEEHEGIVILATNFRKNLDDAFTRRMHHIVEFPFPGPEERERVWRGIVPADAPLSDDVNFAFLARQFELAGGNIRNVALAAAFLAAEQAAPICMEHFVLATAREMQKLGKLPSRSEFREHYDLIRLRA
jgi:AAA+ superfamily predicted ATPase